MTNLEMPSIDVAALARPSTSWHVGLAAIKRLWPVVRDVLRRSWRPLVILHLVQAGFGQFFSYASEYLHQIGREDLTFIAVIALFELVFTMLWAAAWTMMVAHAAAGAVRTGPIGSTAEQPWFQPFNAIVIEQVRALASVLWRAPWLALPAVVRYVRLIFVPLVVLFDHDYQTGKIDALEKSSALSQRHFWFLTIVTVVSLALPWTAESIGESGSLWVWENPLGIGLGWVATFFLDLAATVFLFLVYRLLAPESFQEVE